MPAGAANPLPMLLIMFGIFYLVVFRPQSEAKKTHEAMLKNLKKHDEVVTAGGIFGTILNVKSDTVTLRVDENVRVECEKSAISRLVKPKGADAEPALVEKRA